MSIVLLLYMFTYDMSVICERDIYMLYMYNYI